MKKNVVRRVSCIYPGFFHLPIKEVYALSNNKNEDIECYVSRQFKALNIIDYQNEMKLGDKNQHVKTNAQYEPPKDGAIIEAKQGNDLVAMVQVSIPGKDLFENVKRIHFNSVFTEIVILLYYFDLQQIDNQRIEIPFDDIYYNEIFNRFIDYYILSAADYYISPPSRATVPMYYEAFDLYFDNDIPKDEIREVMVRKKDKYYDNVVSQFIIDDFLNNINSGLKSDVDKNSHIMQSMCSSKPYSSVKLINTLVKAQREIISNKNYKYALLECFTFLESYLTQYLADCKIKAGVSKAKLEDYDEEVSISYKLNIELPIFLRPTDNEREIIGRVDRLRKKRNKIMHNANDNVEITKADADEALAAVHKLYTIIDLKWQKI